MALKIKKGVVLVMIGGSPLCFLIEVATKVFESAGYDCTITAALEGEHSDNSSHYKLLALDFRKREIPTDELPDILKHLRAELGKDYDVIEEKTHIHVQYKPKG